MTTVCRLLKIPRDAATISADRGTDFTRMFSDKVGKYVVCDQPYVMHNGSQCRIHMHYDDGRSFFWLVDDELLESVEHRRLKTSRWIKMKFDPTSPTWQTAYPIDRVIATLDELRETHGGDCSVEFLYATSKFVPVEIHALETDDELIKRLDAAAVPPFVDPGAA